MVLDGWEKFNSIQHTSSDCLGTINTIRIILFVPGQLFQDYRMGKIWPNIDFPDSQDYVSMNELEGTWRFIVINLILFSWVLADTFSLTAKISLLTFSLEAFWGCNK